jgi:hypothetical protein
MEKGQLHKAKARLVRNVSKHGARRLGILRGRIKFQRGWDRPLPDDLLAAFEGRG